MTIGDRFAGSNVRHGTVGGHTLHYRRGEFPCQECKAARTRYDRQRYLERHPQKANIKRDRDRVSKRWAYLASKALREAHPREYQELYLKFKESGEQ